ncbi:MAG TPA: acyl-CoA dehydrogenase family protein [Actinomycetota bacterium]|nr:acyl-CoA dehydrogenase family protein [Actinomycetota bacterium]
MTAFTLSEELSALRESARAFAEREIAPVADEAERTETFPKELFAKAGKAGFIGMRYPTSLGGSEAGILAEVLWREAGSRVNAGIASALSVPGNIGSYPIFEFGSPEQAQTYIPKVTSGEWIGAFALTEPAAGSDVAGIRATAERRNGSWVLNGTKMFITCAPSANFFIFTAYTDRDLGYNGIANFILGRDRLPDEAIRPLKTLGHRSGELGEVVVDGIEVPDDALIGEPTGGFKRAARTLNGGRLIVAGGALGTAQAALDVSVQYARERDAFGHPIGDFQAVAFRLAQVAAEIESARVTTYWAASLWDAGQETPKEIAVAKLMATETAVRATSEGFRTFGGYAYIADEFPIERLLRDARMYVIVEGTSDVQKLILSRQLGLNPR